jgi:two-component system chemotaxis response regulator CheB
MSPRRVRTLVVDDSSIARALLSEFLASDPEVDVVGGASDGAEAVRQTRLLEPDIVVMDWSMPVMSGVQATREIMANSPCPILLVSGDAANLEGAFEPLSVGALDGVQKPPLTAPDGSPHSVSAFLRKVKVLSTVKVIHHRRPRRPWPEPMEPPAPVAGDRSDFCGVVAIASSTGGPTALASVLRSIPLDLRAAVVIVQHTAAGFDTNLVQWMQRESKIPVRLGRHGESLRCGEALVAPSGSHMVVADQGIVALNDDPPVDYQKPSANLLLSSVARCYGASCIGVILSGMGSDGARGAAHISEVGGHTIAQDEATSTVFGMPNAAIALGAVKQVLPIDEIGPRLRELISSSERARRRG